MFHFKNSGLLKSLFILISIGFSFSLFAKTTLKMNHQFPANAVGSVLDQWFADEVFRQSQGVIEIKIYWSNALGEPNENLVLLKNNAIDMAAMSAGYFPKELPLHSAPNSIPMGMDNICQSSRIMDAFLKDIPEFQEEASKNGVRALFFHLLNPYLLVTKKPVTQFAELKGLRIRTWGKDMPRLMKAAGAKSVTLFLPDIYDALKHDVIDGCPFSTDLMKSYKIYELAKHVTEVVLWEGPSWGVWISERAWERLSLENRQLLIKVADQTKQREVQKTLEADKNARAFLKANGVQFHQFPAEELEMWKKASPDFFSDLQRQLEKKGLKKAGKNMIQLWTEIRENQACP